MTAVELSRYQFDDQGYQLERCFEGLSEAQMDAKTTEGSMTPRETLEHFCECYTAFLASMKGEKHNWGTYKLADHSTDALLEEFRKLRTQAVEGALSKGDEETLRHAHLFMTAHDAYHVGQLCLLRLQSDPSWDPYSIYRSE